MVKNRKCLACGTKYSFCPNCSGADSYKPSWASQFCSEDCMTLWQTLTKFGVGLMDKSEAQSIISELDLKPIDNYVNCVQRDYAKVMEKPKRGKRIEIKPIDEAMEIVDIEPQHEVVTIENE